MYRLNEQPSKYKHRKRVVWFWVVLILIIFIGVGGFYTHKVLASNHTVIAQSTAVTTHVSYSSATKTFTEPDFSIQLPLSWTPEKAVPSEYTSYTWQNIDSSNDGQQLVVYEDTIPVNVAVNRVLVVQAADTQVELDGTVSANCATFTNTPAMPNSTAAAAEWNGVNFWCDKVNTERDVVGTSSTAGINTLVLKNSETDVTHKFFFMYTDDSISPDYSVLYNALESFRLNQ
jgi:hypothetical protein